MHKPLAFFIAAFAVCGISAADLELPDLGNPEKRIFIGDKARDNCGSVANYWNSRKSPNTCANWETVLPPMRPRRPVIISS